jgi:hypothetical protein
MVVDILVKCRDNRGVNTNLGTLHEPNLIPTLHLKLALGGL